MTAAAFTHTRARGRTCLRTVEGRVLPLPAHRWLADASEVDAHLLRRALAPVLDVGCGPARHVLALARSGIVTLGIDISLPALELARRRGAPVLHRSVFDRVPGAGRWGTVPLLDGNIGIGGCPEALLRRTAALLRPGGRILVEVIAARAPVERVRFEIDGVPGPWFTWATVDLDGLLAHASAAGLEVRDHWSDGGRGFAEVHS